MASVGKHVTDTNSGKSPNHGCYGFASVWLKCLNVFSDWLDLVNADSANRAEGEKPAALDLGGIPRVV